MIALYFLADLESAAGRPEAAKQALTEGLQILASLDDEGRLAEDSPYRGWIDDLQTALDELP